MIKILHLEDNALDSELVQSMINDEIKTPIEWKVVTDEHEFITALQSTHFDLIFSDHHLCNFSSSKALQIREKICPDVPFILLSGALTEESAISAIKYGATDFILKTNLNRLIPATNRALHEYNELKIQRKLKLEKTIMEKLLQQKQMHLIQSEKMATLGQLASGIAHEINNPLGFINSNIKTLEEYMNIIKNLLQCLYSLTDAVFENDSQKASNIISEIEQFKSLENIPSLLLDIDCIMEESKDGIERMRAIVKNLKTFARKDDNEFEEANINDGIESTIKMVWHELKNNCEIHKNLNLIPKIKCIPGQINQVVMNLIINAGQSIKDKGNIYVKTQKTHSGVEIIISDTGSGINSENLEKIFDPFFTTKPPGIGTGLGLSICRDIIQAHKGSIDVKSDLDKGTTFTIKLPLNPFSEIEGCTV